MPVALRLGRLLLAAVLFLPQWFWLGRGWRLATRFRRPWLVIVVRVFLAIAPILIGMVLVDRISGRFLPPALSVWIAPPVQLWVFTSAIVYFCLQVFHATIWLSSSVSRLLISSPSSAPPDPKRRLLLRRTAIILGGMPFVVALYGFAIERLRFRVVRVDLPVAHLPSALDGLRIVQLSDIHAGDFMPDHEIRRAVHMANRLQAHLAVVTGDFITGRGDPLAACIRELSALHAPLGVWGCNGNHEISAGVEQLAQDLFRQHGMTLLRQSAAQLSWNGAQFNLIGIDYQHEVNTPGVPGPPIAFIAPLIRHDMPNLLLSHNPNTFYSAARLGIELSLAGHTHGGQITLNFINKNLNPARLMTRFVAGPYHLPMPPRPVAPSTAEAPLARLYVNRGLGTLGVPARIGSDPEITLLTLRSAT